MKNYYIIIASFNGTSVIFPYIYEFTEFDISDFQERTITEAHEQLCNRISYGRRPESRFRIKVEYNLIHMEK